MTVKRFDYGSVDDRVAARLRRAAKKIRNREIWQVEHFVETGVILKQLRYSIRLLGGDQNNKYDEWLETEALLTPEHEQERLRAAEVFLHPGAANSIPVNGFHRLVAREAPADLLVEVARRIRRCERITPSLIDHIFARVGGQTTQRAMEDRDRV